LSAAYPQVHVLDTLGGMREADLEHPIAASPHEAAASLAQTFGDDVVIVEARSRRDARGVLVEFDPDALPFVVRRIFTVGDVPPDTVRGGHRHRSGSQALFCTAGRVDVVMRRGTVSHDPVTLTPESPGLCIAAGVWAAQHYIGDGSALLVLASDHYDPDSYEQGW
jgi:dTDP-4-dehydrorhamnose 3,5-epimerase-like enzyme